MTALVHDLQINRVSSMLASPLQGLRAGFMVESYRHAASSVLPITHSGNMLFADCE